METNKLRAKRQILNVKIRQLTIRLERLKKYYLRRLDNSPIEEVDIGESLKKIRTRMEVLADQRNDLMWMTRSDSVTY